LEQALERIYDPPQLATKITPAGISYTLHIDVTKREHFGTVQGVQGCCRVNSFLLTYLRYSYVFCRSTHTEPVRVRDESGNTTRFCIHMNSGPSDNPMQSEVAGHIGGKGNHPCRKCEVGGTQEEKRTNEGFHALFEVSLYRLSTVFLPNFQGGHTSDKREDCF
jgi:hypothetical protein